MIDPDMCIGTEFQGRFQDEFVKMMIDQQE